MHPFAPTPFTSTSSAPARQGDPRSRIQRVRHELKLRPLQVAEVQRLSPGFIRVRLTGPTLEDFRSLSFDDHVKLMLPTAAGDARRDFTPRHHDAAARTLDLEFALHAQGPASDWARQAAPGQSLTVGGPRGSMILPLDVDWHLLAGDATALPAIARRLEELPPGARVISLVHVADAADVRALDTRADAQVQWVHRAADFQQALRELTLPAGEGFAWAAGEAQAMRQARELLVQHHGLHGHAMRVSAYWKQGASDFHETLEG